MVVALTAAKALATRRTKPYATQVAAHLPKAGAPFGAPAATLPIARRLRGVCPAKPDPNTHLIFGAHAAEWLGLQSDGPVLLWVQNRDSTWRTGCDGKQLREVQGVRLAVPDFSRDMAARVERIR